MTDSLHCLSNGFFIHNTSGAKGYCKPQTFFYHIFQYFNLDLTHHLSPDFFRLFFPDQMKQRLFFLQLHQLPIYHMRLCPCRKYELISKYRCQHRPFQGFLHAKALSRIGGFQPGNGADLPGNSLVFRAELHAGIKTDLVRFFFANEFFYF